MRPIQNARRQGVGEAQPKAVGPMLAAALAGLIAASAYAGRPAESGAGPHVEAAWDLPEAPDNYADPDLPRHFRNPTVLAFDNTPPGNPTTNEGATLGRVLFYDRRLSADGSISCGSCHQQARAFSDAGRFSKGVGGRLGDRNAMSLVEARYAAGGRFFWDGRAESLERQVLAPIENPAEMAHTLPRVVEVIGHDDRYAELFRRAFGDPEVTADRIARALAQFVRAMVSYRSKFDEGMARAWSISDPFPNFTPRENLGKAVFLGDHDRSSRGNCATCHLRGFAFRLPRDRDAQQAVFLMEGPRNNGLEAELVGGDNGVGDLTLDPADYGRFKSPSLRNVELTAPYMHDGRFATLEEVVDHYDSGLKPHPNVDIHLRNPPRRPGRPELRTMRLDAEEKTALVAFLRTLTDTAFVTDPKFSDPFRKTAATSPEDAATARRPSGERAPPR